MFIDPKFNDIPNLVMKLADVYPGGRPKVVAILREFDARNVSQVPVGKLGELHQRLVDALAKPTVESLQAEVDAPSVLELKKSDHK